jgi:hypothetical protein
MRGRLDQHDLQGGANVSLQQVATSRRSVEPPHDHVGVDLRLTVLLCDISHQRENLDLLADGDLTVLLRTASRSNPTLPPETRQWP